MTDKRIGIYSSHAKAEAALSQVKDQPGFRDFPEGFSISEWFVDPERVGWPEGFIMAFPDGTFSD
jgi:hypothetical protein